MSSPPDTLALAIASASAAVSLAGVVGQWILYKLAGSRLHVQLVPCAADEYGNVATGPANGWRAKPHKMHADMSPWTIDLARVTVTNVGRTAVSIAPVEINFGRPRWWRRGWHSMAGFPVQILEGNSTNDRRRLEPGQAVDVYFDIWILISEIRKSRPGREVFIRGQATAISRRPTLSQRRWRWLVRTDDETLRPFVDVTPELRAFWATWRAFASQHENRVSLEWPAIRDALASGGDREQIREVMDTFVSDGPHHLNAYNVYSAYHLEKSDHDRSQ